MAKSVLQKKIGKLIEIAQDLRDGNHFNITRLTSIKSLCKDPKTANQFCHYLAKLTYQKMMEKDRPDYIEPNTWVTYQQLARNALQSLESYLEDSSQDNQKALQANCLSLYNQQNHWF